MKLEFTFSDENKEKYKDYFIELDNMAFKCGLEKKSFGCYEGIVDNYEFTQFIVKTLSPNVIYKNANTCFVSYDEEDDFMEDALKSMETVMTFDKEKLKKYNEHLKTEIEEKILKPKEKQKEKKSEEELLSELKIRAQESSINDEEFQEIVDTFGLEFFNNSKSTPKEVFGPVDFIFSYSFDKKKVNKSFENEKEAYNQFKKYLAIFGIEGNEFKGFTTTFPITCFQIALISMLMYISCPTMANCLSHYSYAICFITDVPDIIKEIVKNKKGENKK